MPKRKSKLVKGSGQPVAKKREIESKRTNEADSTPVVRGRSGTRGEVSTPAKATTPSVRVGGSAKKRVNAIKSASKKSAPIISTEDETTVSKFARSSRTTTPVAQKTVSARTSRARTPVAESQSVTKKATGRTPKTSTPISPKKAVRGRTPRSKTPAAAASQPVASERSSRSTTPVTASPPVSKKTRSAAKTPTAARQPIGPKIMTPVISLRPVPSRLSAKKAVTASAKKRTDRLRNASTSVHEDTKKLSPKKLSPFAKANSKASPKKSPSKASSTRNSPASKKEVGAISTVEPQPPRSTSIITQRCCVS